MGIDPNNVAERPVIAQIKLLYHPPSHIKERTIDWKGGNLAYDIKTTYLGGARKGYYTLHVIYQGITYKITPTEDGYTKERVDELPTKTE